ncbi:hypothetical protein CDL15_Pgr011309 [Punica granatum]|uniref:Uncharacterized protein n=1 Tax=Punica granatum TaxID=22663 RepID=A0A218WGN0_PUNGR|nr:hypothetical protein CDL15_Pgr011309 [Punica granatum]
MSFAVEAVSLEIKSSQPIFLEISIYHVFCRISLHKRHPQCPRSGEKQRHIDPNILSFQSCVHHLASFLHSFLSVESRAELSAAAPLPFAAAVIPGGSVRGRLEYLHSQLQGVWPSDKKELKYPPDPGFETPWSHQSAFGVITCSVRRREFTESRGLVGRNLDTPG